MTTTSTLTVTMAHDQSKSTMATLTTDLSRNQPHGLAWALGCLAQHRDGEAWSTLVAQVGPDIQRLAVCLIGDFALAEDAVQETLLLVRDHAGRFAVRSGNGDDDARRWILGVAANASRQIVRRHGRQLQRDRDAGRMAAQVALPIVDPSQRAENVDQSMLLRRELAELPDVYGQVLTLHYFGGQDYSMLATDLRVSIHTVRSRVHRGLKALRERLDRCGVTLSIAALTGLLSNLGAATTVGGAATVSASTLGLISSTAVPTTSFSAVSSGLTMATVMTSAFAALLALVVLSGVWLSSFRAESTPPPIAAAGGAAEVGNKAQVAPFILVVKTDQMVVVKVPGADEKKTWIRETQIDSQEKFLLTSGPDQFRLPLHPFVYYDFTVDWGDGTTGIVRSDAAAGQAMVDETWLAQVKNGLDKSVTFETFETINHDDPYDPFKCYGRFWVAVDSSINGTMLWASGSEKKESKIERYLRYLLRMAGIDTCANIHVDPKVREKAGLQRVEALVSKQQFGAMKLSEVFDQLTKVTGLTYTLHDRALFITERKDLPLSVCPQHTYAKAGTYTVKITENVIGGFPQIYFNGGYDCVKVMDLAQWGGNTWVSLDAAFMGCANMTIGASDAATAVTGAVKKISYAWSGCSGLTNFPLLNTAAGMDFSAAWSGCTGLTSFPLLNTSAGTNFMKAWGDCCSLTNFPLLNTSAGTDFSAAWHGCSDLTSFPLLNTSAGTNFSVAWGGCSGLTSFPLLDTSAGTNFNFAWSGCSGLTSFPLLDTSAGTAFGRAWSGCSGLTNFPLLNTSAGTDFDRAWSDCSRLTSFPLLNTSAGTIFDGAWSNCSGLTSFPLLNTSAGTKFSWAWYCCSGLTSFPLLNTSAGTNFSEAWAWCSRLTSFPLLNTSTGTDFGDAWCGCSGLTSFPLLNTSVGTNFSSAWFRCGRLTNFPLLNFGKMEQAERCFFEVTLTSASYGELLANIAALNKVSDVDFDGGFSKAQGLIGIQAREKLVKKLGWTIYDGDHLKLAPQDAAPAKPQPQPEAANVF